MGDERYRFEVSKESLEEATESVEYRLRCAMNAPSDKSREWFLLRAREAFAHFELVLGKTEHP